MLSGSARLLDDAVDAPWRKFVGTAADGCLADGLQDFRLGSRKTNVILDAENHSLGLAAFFNYKTAALFGDLIQKRAHP